MTSHLKRRKWPSTRLLWTVLCFSKKATSIVSALDIGRRRRLRGGLHKVFAAAQRVNIGRQHLDRHRIEPAAPSRHRAHVGRSYLRIDLLARAAVEPDRVGEVGRADHAIAAAVDTVT